MEKLICGIDEAGRGPVIGPLVIAGVAIAEDKLPRLRGLGVRDSKLLTPKQREKLYPKIIKLVDAYKIIKISPSEIDSRNAVGTNLNYLEALKAAEIIKELKPVVVYIDSPTSPNAMTFAGIISKYLGAQLQGIENKNCFLYSDGEVEIIAEHEADFKYPVCSAASILAKIERDREIAEIQKQFDEDIGSGYPSDPITQEFLKKNHSKLGNLVRKTWSTYQELKKNKEQRGLGEF